MKIAIPSEGDKGLQEHIAEHFGRCPFYTILDENKNVLQILKNTSAHMGGQLQPPELLAENGIQVLLCRGIGRKALGLGKELGIDIYVDYNSTTVEGIFDQYKANSLSKADLNDSCTET